MSRLSRRAYAELYGPTTGDRLRLADTELIVEVERDFTTYGDEVSFGGPLGPDPEQAIKLMGAAVLPHFR